MKNVKEKELFYKGDLVTFKKNVSNAPNMLVERIERIRMNKDGEDSFILLGVKCMWFDVNQQLRYSLFNTKDITKVKHETI